MSSDKPRMDNNRLIVVSATPHYLLARGVKEGSRDGSVVVAPASTIKRVAHGHTWRSV